MENWFSREVKLYANEFKHPVGAQHAAPLHINTDRLQETFGDWEMKEGLSYRANTEVRPYGNAGIE